MVENRLSHEKLTSQVEVVQLPPTAARIFRVAAGLAEWTPQERAWLKKHPGVIAYQDQLQATLEDVRRRLGHTTDGTEEECTACGSRPIAVYEV